MGKAAAGKCVKISKTKARLSPTRVEYSGETSEHPPTSFIATLQAGSVYGLGNIIYTINLNG